MSPHGHWGPPMDDRPPVAPAGRGLPRAPAPALGRLAAPPARHRRPRAQGPRARRAASGPTARKTILMFVALTIGVAASLAPAPLAAAAIDKGIVPGDVAVLNIVVALYVLSVLIVWGTSFAQTWLTGWVGQRALADLRQRIFAHLQPMPIGFYERRPAGVLISRMTNDVEALDSLVTDTVVTLFQATPHADRLDRDPAAARLAAGAARLPDLPDHGARVADLPDRQRRRLPPHARDDRLDHRRPAGDAVRASASCARSPASRSTATASPSSTSATSTRT